MLTLPLLAASVLVRPSHLEAQPEGIDFGPEEKQEEVQDFGGTVVLVTISTISYLGYRFPWKVGVVASQDIKNSLDRSLSRSASVNFPNLLLLGSSSHPPSQGGEMGSHYPAKTTASTCKFNQTIWLLTLLLAFSFPSDRLQDEEHIANQKKPNRLNFCPV